MNAKLPWFSKGLRFKCTGCGKCCTGAPGYVFLSSNDLTALAKLKEIEEEEFKRLYTRMVDGQLCLIDRPKTNACVFLKDNRCSVYDARPVQCRTFPWWLHTIQSEKSWKEAGEDCEGINHPDAPLIPGKDIAIQCTTYLDNLIEQNFRFDPSK